TAKENKKRRNCSWMAASAKRPRRESAVGESKQQMVSLERLPTRVLQNLFAGNRLEPGLVSEELLLPLSRALTPVTQAAGRRLREVCPREQMPTLGGKRCDQTPFYKPVPIQGYGKASCC